MDSQGRVAGIAGRARSAGQAMTELVVVMITFMIPLFLIIELLSQTVSVRQDAESAVRYSAFQRTIWKGTNAEIDPNFQATEPALAPATVKSDDQIAKEVDTRVFANGDSAIYTTEVNPTLELKPFDMTPLAVTSPRTLVPLIATRAGSTPASPRYASQTSTDSALSGTEGTLIKDGVINAFKGLRFDMDTKGLIQAKLSFDMVQIPAWLWPTQSLGVTRNLSMSRSMTLFTDGWTPGGRADARYRSAGLLPEELGLDTPAIHNVQNKFSPTIAKVVRCNVYESDCYLDFGYTNVDAVPSDRLTN